MACFLKTYKYSRGLLFDFRYHASDSGCLLRGQKNIEPLFQCFNSLLFTFANEHDLTLSAVNSPLQSITENSQSSDGFLGFAFWDCAVQNFTFVRMNIAVNQLVESRIVRKLRDTKSCGKNSVSPKQYPFFHSLECESRVSRIQSFV